MAIHQMSSIFSGTVNSEDACTQVIEEMLNIDPDAMLTNGRPVAIEHEESTIVTVTFSSRIYDTALRIACDAIFDQMEFLSETLSDAPFLTDTQRSEYSVVIGALIDRVRETFTQKEN